MTETLSDAMDFDHPIEVLADGTWRDAPDGIYGPELRDEQPDSDRWELVTAGLTGQHGYDGPILHNSEQIAGAVERRVLERPGIYVALVAYWTPEDEPEGLTGDTLHDGEPDDAEGWAIARLKDQDCRHCGRTLTRTSDGWVDPAATGDDAVWRETCDAHDTFAAEHEPANA